ncbi:MAG: LptF/LptG family permease, partial [Verrucomicrobiota bacterium]
GLPISRLIEFYLVQIPFLILFVLPIVILLSLLFGISKMSKANELISMIGSGRSVPRVLFPVFFIGVYASLLALALKYEWSPRSNATKEALMKRTGEERRAIEEGRDYEIADMGLVQRRGWMHVNEYARRTWFISSVPLRLSDPMLNVVVWHLDENSQPKTVWVAKRAQWNYRADPPSWKFIDGKIYQYGEDKIPRITSFKEHTETGWNETPWKVMSSAENPEFLGLPSLSMYLNANKEMDPVNLAPFRTNWWYISAEPFSCLAMVLVAAPLGIVHARRGVMGGVVAAIAIFAVMYILRGTMLAMGQGSKISPFIAAWATNFIVGGIGLVLLWFRSQNREIPKLRALFKSLFSRNTSSA